MRHVLILLVFLLTAIVAAPGISVAHDMPHSAECPGCDTMVGGVEGGGDHQCQHGGHVAAATLAEISAAPSPLHLVGSSGLMAGDIDAPSRALQTDLPPPRA